MLLFDLHALGNTLSEFSFIEFLLVCFRFCKNEVPGCEDSIERWQFFSLLFQDTVNCHAEEARLQKKKIWFRQFSVDLGSTIFAYKLVSTGWKHCKIT